MKKHLSLLLLLSISISLFADPPLPPLGKRWVMNPDFSDEFNGTQLDESKWLDHHPTWKGREPGLFMPSQVSVKDGYLQIRGEKMEKDTIIKAYGRELNFNIKGGAVVSKKPVFLGYYECRLKASATTMSATFWFSSGKGGKGPNGCDSYGLEWDIQECIGRVGDFSGSYFASGMHSNSHYWYNDCDGKRHDYRAPQVKFEEKELASENFHVYGGWWHDETMASYYYDNGQPKYQKFYNKVSDKPFDKPMYMRLVVETYPFPWISLPTDQELANPNNNVVYYDWVRGYKLVDADDANANKINMEAVIELYYEDIVLPDVEMEFEPSQSLQIPLSYKANKDREIYFKLTDTDGKKLAEMTKTVYAGYANMKMDFALKKKLKKEASYTLSAQIRPIGGDNKSVLNASTMVINISK